MAFTQETPKDFDATLITRVIRGTAFVISANEYNSLPSNLKYKYYPLFRRADTTYRLFPQYMSARKDTDPNTQVVTIVPLRKVPLTPQIDRTTPKTLQKEVLPINPYVSIPNTELSKKSLNQITQETKSTLKNYVGVTTQYTRY